MLMYVRRLNNYQNSLLSPFFGILEDFHFFIFGIFFKRLFCARARKEFTSRNAFTLLVLRFLKYQKYTSKSVNGYPDVTDPQKVGCRAGFRGHFNEQWQGKINVNKIVVKYNPPQVVV